jgi:hypothetical protein
MKKGILIAIFSAVATALIIFFAGRWESGLVKVSYLLENYARADEIEKKYVGITKLAEFEVRVKGLETKTNETHEDVKKILLGLIATNKDFAAYILRVSQAPPFPPDKTKPKKKPKTEVAENKDDL